MASRTVLHVHRGRVGAASDMAPRLCNVHSVIGQHVCRISQVLSVFTRVLAHQSGPNAETIQTDVAGYYW